VVDGPQQMKNPLQSLIAPEVQVNPTLVQHRQVAAPQLQVLIAGHLSRVLEQYCSLVLYIPEGIVRVHNV
jgi:ABC-type phosphate/phosphonate transport system permease subunit